MRITGGIARGISLSVPKGNKTRPATDQKREALFSSLGPLGADIRVLDLYAGTGSYGLEALSRGAGRVDFVENNSHCSQILSRNIAGVSKSLSAGGCLNPGHARINRVAVFTFLKRVPLQPYDLVIADPPYEETDNIKDALLAGLVDLLDPERGRLALEVPGDVVVESPDWVVEKTIGKSRPDSPKIVLLRLRR